MTIVSQIITDAFRESNNIAIGQQPSQAEQVEALTLFNRFVRSTLGAEAGENFISVTFGNQNVQGGYNYNPATVPINWFPIRNARIFFNNQTAQSLYLNTNPQDGERLSIQDMSGNFSTYPVTLYGNGRTIDGATAQVLSTNNLRKEYFFRADTGDWKTVNDLAMADTFPFPEEFEDYFVIGLATRINPRNNTQIDPQSVEMWKRLGRQFRARYKITTPTRSELALLRLPSRYEMDGAFSSYPGYFETGYRPLSSY